MSEGKVSPALVSEMSKRIKDGFVSNEDFLKVISYQNIPLIALLGKSQHLDTPAYARLLKADCEPAHIWVSSNSKVDGKLLDAIYTSGVRFMSYAILGNPNAPAEMVADVAQRFLLDLPWLARGIAPDEDKTVLEELKVGKFNLTNKISNIMAFALSNDKVPFHIREKLILDHAHLILQEPYDFDSIIIDDVLSDNLGLFTTYIIACFITKGKIPFPKLKVLAATSNKYSIISEIMLSSNITQKQLVELTTPVTEENIKALLFAGKASGDTILDAWNRSENHDFFISDHELLEELLTKTDLTVEMADVIALRITSQPNFILFCNQKAVTSQHVLTCFWNTTKCRDLVLFSTTSRKFVFASLLLEAKQLSIKDLYNLLENSNIERTGDVKFDKEYSELIQDIFRETKIELLKRRKTKVMLKDYLAEEGIIDLREYPESWWASILGWPAEDSKGNR